MYQAYALMTPKSDLTIPEAARRIQAKFPNIDVNQTGGSIDLTEGDWDYHLALQSGPQVLEEAEGLAGRIAGLEDDDAMRTCDRRFEVWSDTPDPFMEYFERHFQILDVLRGFKGVILVDPREPSLV